MYQHSGLNFLTRQKPLASSRNVFSHSIYALVVVRSFVFGQNTILAIFEFLVGPIKKMLKIKVIGHKNRH